MVNKKKLPKHIQKLVEEDAKQMIKDAEISLANRQRFQQLFSDFQKSTLSPVRHG